MFTISVCERCSERWGWDYQNHYRQFRTFYWAIKQQFYVSRVREHSHWEKGFPHLAFINMTHFQSDFMKIISISQDLKVFINWTLNWIICLLSVGACLRIKHKKACFQVFSVNFNHFNYLGMLWVLWLMFYLNSISKFW